MVTKCVGIFTSKPKFRALIEGAVHDTGADSLMGTNPYDGLPSCMLSAVVCCASEVTVASSDGCSSVPCSSVPLCCDVPLACTLYPCTLYPCQMC